MGFFDRGGATPSKTATSRTPAPSGGKKPTSYRDPDPNAPTYGNGPRQEWYGDPNERIQHTPGSSRAQQSGWWEGSGKNLKSPRWSDRDTAFDYTPDKLAAEAAARQPYVDKKNALLGGDEAYQQAKGAGDLKGQIAAMLALRNRGQLDRFIEQGGSEDTWKNRFAPDANWPVPKSPLGTETHNPNGGGASTGDRALNMPSSGRTGGAGGIQGFLGDQPSTQPAIVPAGAIPEWAKAQGGATTGQSDVLAALSRLQGMPLGAPTAATGAMGGFGRAASGIAPAMAAASAAKKPTMVRRGGGVVSVR